jgi:hypothetical protein
MTWIKTIPLSEASQQLLQALESQRPLYPKEYEAPVFKTDDELAGIVASHSLIPDALFHAFAIFGGAGLVVAAGAVAQSGQRHQLDEEAEFGDAACISSATIVRNYYSHRFSAAIAGVVACLHPNHVFTSVHVIAVT